MKSRRLKFGLIAVAIIAAIFLTNTAVYFVTYNNPIIIGDRELYEKYKDDCLNYSHALMGDCLGISAHAQIINIQKGEGQIIILLTSFIPPSRTKVWHSEGEAPYWETGLRTFAD